MSHDSKDTLLDARVTVRLPKNLARKVKRDATVFGLTVAEYLRLALENQIKYDNLEKCVGWDFIVEGSYNSNSLRVSPFQEGQKRQKAKAEVTA